VHPTGDEMLDQILNHYLRSETVYYDNKKWVDMTEYELWQELCLCILSSNVPYELACSAFAHLMEKGYLKIDWMMKMPNSSEVIAEELSKPMYLPRKLDGSYRRYRFPNARARNIVQAASVVSSEESWLSKLLVNSVSEREVRDSLVFNIPGLGLKEASHFLRNIRYSNQLAIIDSHVVSFLEEIGWRTHGNTRTITRSVYLELESQLQEICEKHGLNLSILDMAIWHYMRRKQ